MLPVLVREPPTDWNRGAETDFYASRADDADAPARHLLRLDAGEDHAFGGGPRREVLGHGHGEPLISEDHLHRRRCAKAPYTVL